jgi:hypothetical protein
MDKGKIVSDTKGDYDAVGKPNLPKSSKIETEKGERKDKEEKKKKKIKADKTLKGLNKGVVDKLLGAKINNIELVLNLTERDLENLDFTKKEKETLEDFVRKYLNSKEE